MSRKLGKMVNTNPGFLEEVLARSVLPQRPRIDVVAVGVDVLCCLGDLPEAVEAILLLVLLGVLVSARKTFKGVMRGGG